MGCSKYSRSFFIFFRSPFLSLSVPRGSGRGLNWDVTCVILFHRLWFFICMCTCSLFTSIPSTKLFFTNIFRPSQWRLTHPYGASPFTFLILYGSLLIFPEWGFLSPQNSSPAAPLHTTCPEQLGQGNFRCGDS